MIYILHGEDSTSARNFLLNLQAQNKIDSRIELVLEDLNLKDLASSKLALETKSMDMFGQSKLIVLDVSKMGRTNVDSLIDFLKECPTDIFLIIYSAKELSKANAFIKNTQSLKARVMEFKKKDKANIFSFVDAVFSRDRPNAFKQLRKLLLEGEDAVYLLTMLSYGLRNVAYAKFNSSLFHKIPPFNKSKVKTMSEKFSEREIENILEMFYEMDRGIKYGEYDPAVVIPVAVEKVVTY
uniref:DNA polymerase III subunit delta n=1 Tax=candidate division WWE3 bacterium TaxID=2053526 RepID=A0A7C4TPQ2_UNCKA